MNKQKRLTHKISARMAAFRVRKGPLISIKKTFMCTFSGSRAQPPIHLRTLSTNFEFLTNQSENCFEKAEVARLLVWLLFRWLFYKEWSDFLFVINVFASGVDNVFFLHQSRKKGAHYGSDFSNRWKKHNKHQAD